MSATPLLIAELCSEACEAAPTCATCGKRKAPFGRDVAAAAGADYCGPAGCTGYFEKPTAGHLWPGELRQARERAASNE